jgi:hypothetical protein
MIKEAEQFSMKTHVLKSYSQTLIINEMLIYLFYFTNINIQTILPKVSQTKYPVNDGAIFITYTTGTT